MKYSSGRWFRPVAVAAMFHTFHYCLFTALLGCVCGQYSENMNHATNYKLTSEQQEELLKIHNDYRSHTAVEFGAANLEPLVN